MADFANGEGASDEPASRASRALQRHGVHGPPIPPDRSLDVPGALQARASEVVPVRVDRPDGVIAGFRANQLSRRAALAQLSEYYAAQLEVVKARLAETVRVRKAEAALKAEEFLATLNGDHLRFLTQLGLQNEEIRTRALIELNEQTTRGMREIEARDWPPEMINATLDVVVDRYRKFMARLASDLEER